MKFISLLLISSVALIVLTVGCDLKSEKNKNNDFAINLKEKKDFVKAVKQGLVFVGGGEFLMGDFGVQYGSDKLPFDPDKDSRPLHLVRLSSYSIQKFKITNEEYLFYKKINDLKVERHSKYEENKLARIALRNPANLDWFEASQYCKWLADVSNLPFTLPTEAQWEYAARSRGQFFSVATDDGSYKITDASYTANWEDGPRGINISTDIDRMLFAREMGWTSEGLTLLPVDRFPPNPLGLYAMSDNGLEWVSDWYDPDYYQSSPVQDPQGPELPVFKDLVSNNEYAKVLRGADYADPLLGMGVNVHRAYRSPDGNIHNPWSERDLRAVKDKTARCVVNSPEPIARSKAE
ncbi:formylglycine-generating enzyme family protein [Pseudomonas putida]